MKRIVQWVEREGVEGFLNFEGKELKIALNDQREEKSEKKEETGKKRHRTASLDSSEKKF